MRTLRWYLGLAVFLFVLSATEAQSFLTMNSVTFYFMDVDVSFEDAVQVCTDANRFIAVLDNEELNKAIYEALLVTNNGSTPWIGVQKPADTCQYRTVGGNRIPNFQNFVATTNYDEDWCATLQVFPFDHDDFQSIFPHGEWLGRLCNETHPVICSSRRDPDCDTCDSKCDDHPFDFPRPKQSKKRKCSLSCQVRDACPGQQEPRERDLDKYCFFQPKPRVDTFENALGTCRRFGGTILNILTRAEYMYFVNNGFFELCNVWDQYFLGLYQKPGTGAARWTSNGRVCTLGRFFEPYFGYSHFNLISHDLGLNFWSSKDKSGLVLVLQAKTDAWATLSPHPVAIDSPSIHAKYERRSARHALYWCEAKRDDFCMSIAFDIPYADKYYADCDDVTFDCHKDVVIVYSCWNGYEFQDGDTYKRVKCLCDRRTFRGLIPRKGCALIDKCRGPHPCDHFCLGYSHGVYRCGCKSGFKLGSKGECIDIDECKDLAYSKCPIAPYGGCRNTYGSFHCYCNVGYDMDHAGFCQVNVGGFSVDYITIFFYIYKTLPAGSFGTYDSNNVFHEHLRLGLKPTFDPWFRSRPESYDLREIRRFQKDIICVVVRIHFVTKISVRDQSYISFSILKRVNDPKSIILINSERTRFFPDLTWLTDSGKEIKIKTPCSIAVAIKYCPEQTSSCEVKGDYAECKCHKGFTKFGGICSLKKKDKKDDGWTALEIFLFVAVIVLIVMMICICICICSLCSRIGRGGSGSAIYGSTGPQFFPHMTKVFHSGPY